MLLVMMAMNPMDKKIYYFVDKCLPFGSSISCAIFQRFSNAVAHLVRFRTKKPLVNYLDDYFFAALRKLLCDLQLQTFLNVCEEINFPVALEKTFWSETIMTFLGLLLDSDKQIISISLEKIVKALEMLDSFLSRKSRKVKVLDMQKLCGFLNFLCRCVVPGRVFHIKLSAENRLDLWVWKAFLQNPDMVSRPFMDYTVLSAQDIDMYSDASRNFDLDFGAYCGPEWTYGQWDKNFMTANQPNIEFLELFGVTVAVLNWLKLFKNKRICLFCDNEAVVHMINSSSSKCKRCMALLRIVILECMVQNTRVSAKHVGTKQNGKADALSRLDFKRFRRLGPNMNQNPSSIPEKVWPLQKVWLV